MASVLKSRLVFHGHKGNLDQYYKHLMSADVVVSTAKREFFGVPVMEAVICGCVPVVPKRGAFVELYGDVVSEMNDTDQDLYFTLKMLCKRKRDGVKLPSFATLAYPFEAFNWFENLYEIMYAPLKKLPPREEAPCFSRRLKSEKDQEE